MSSAPSGGAGRAPGPSASRWPSILVTRSPAPGRRSGVGTPTITPSACIGETRAVCRSVQADAEGKDAEQHEADGQRGGRPADDPLPPARDAAGAHRRRRAHASFSCRIARHASSDSLRAHVCRILTESGHRPVTAGYLPNQPGGHARGSPSVATARSRADRLGAGLGCRRGGGQRPARGVLRAGVWARPAAVRLAGHRQRCGDHGPVSDLRAGGAGPPGVAAATAIGAAGHRGGRGRHGVRRRTAAVVDRASGDVRRAGASGGGRIPAGLRLGADREFGRASVRRRCRGRSPASAWSWASASRSAC